MIDNRASLCNSKDTVADFVTDPFALMQELEIREIAPEKVVGILPVQRPNVDSLTRQPQFRVLYRQFLFRMVDFELLSAQAQGDMSKLFGQVASLLIWLSLGPSLAGFLVRTDRMQPMQRLLFARVMLQDAQVIMLDEPFNAIDTRTAGDLLALVKRWHQEGRTVLAALHDLETVRAHFPETLLFARGPVAWGPTGEVLTSENLQVAMRM